MDQSAKFHLILSIQLILQIHSCYVSRDCIRNSNSWVPQVPIWYILKMHGFQQHIMYCNHSKFRASSHTQPLLKKKVSCEPKPGKREIGEKQDSALLLLLKGLKLSSILFNFKFHIRGKPGKS